MDVGVIGLNGFAARMIEEIRRHPHLRIRHGYHPDQEKAARWDAQLGTSRLEDLLLSDSVEAVFILTPTHTHADFCRKFISARKHVFVEKPLTHRLDDARDISRELKASPVKFMVGHSFRRFPWFRKAKELMGSGAIGKVFNVTINKSHGAIFDLPETSWRKDADAHPEGPLSTVGTHFFDLLHDWFGRIDSVNAILTNVADRSAAPDANAVMMQCGNGVTVFLQTNYCQCSEDSVHVYGTEGTIYCDRSRLSLRVGRDRERVPSEKREIPSGENLALAEEIDEFYKSIAEGGAVETGLREGLDAMIVLDACRVSHEQKRVVRLDEYRDYFCK